jgi:hypothetical protein
MNLRMVVRDCLFLNWALPAAALPEPPAPLRYQLHAWRGCDHVFVSALLFHQDSVRFSALPMLRIRYPQLTLSLAVLDEEGYPSVLVQRVLMPSWMAPGVRLVTGQPASGAHLDFPRPSRQVGADSWHWRATRDGTLSVRAWLDSPRVGEGPPIGSWEETVRYFQERPRGYVEVGGKLTRMEASHRSAEVWPLRAELDGSDLLPKLLPLAAPSRPSASGDGANPTRSSATALVAGAAGAAGGEPAAWPPLHSSWLSPEMPLSFSVDLAPAAPVVHRVPHPAAGRVTSPALHAGALEPVGAGNGAAEARRASC